MGAAVDVGATAVVVVLSWELASIGREGGAVTRGPMTARATIPKREAATEMPRRLTIPRRRFSAAGLLLRTALRVE